MVFVQQGGSLLPLLNLVLERADEFLHKSTGEKEETTLREIDRQTDR